MQLRFDGQLAFPGGFVGRRLRSLKEGLNRVLAWGLGRGTCLVAEEDYLVSHIARGPRRLVAHLYVKRLSLPELHVFELQALCSHDHGLQVMGTVRVPLYVQRHSLGGLPAFLRNSFVGTAKFQLLYAPKVLNMVPEEKLAQAVAAAQAPQKTASGTAATPPVVAGSSASTPALSPSEPA